MKKRNPIYTAGSFLLAGALTLSMAACSGAQAPAEATQTPSAAATPAATAAPAEETTPSAPVSGALPVKALQPKQIEENPYMAKSDANIHHDGYNTDSTDEILPLGIYPEIHVSYETTNANASPAIYFDSYGHAVVTMDVSNKYGYNNMAIGMYTGNSGNALYCPTGYLELLRLQDRFVYLPELPYREVDLDQAARNVLAQEQFAQDGGEGTVASWRNTAAIRNVHPNTTVAFRMNNLSGSTSDLTLYAYGADGKLAKVAPELWSITDETGAAVTELTDGVLYELRVTVADGGDFDLSETEKEIKLSVVLGK